MEQEIQESYYELYETIKKENESTLNKMQEKFMLSLKKEKGIDNKVDDEYDKANIKKIDNIVRNESDKKNDNDEHQD